MKLAPEVYSSCDAAGRRGGGKVSGRDAGARRSASIAEDAPRTGERARDVSRARARARRVVTDALAKRPTRSVMAHGDTYRARAGGANLDRTRHGDGAVAGVDGGVRAGEGEREDGDSAEGTHGV